MKILLTRRQQQQQQNQQVPAHSSVDSVISSSISISDFENNNTKELVKDSYNLILDRFTSDDNGHSESPSKLDRNPYTSLSFFEATKEDLVADKVSDSQGIFNTEHFGTQTWKRQPDYSSFLDQELRETKRAHTLSSSISSSGLEPFPSITANMVQHYNSLKNEDDVECPDVGLVRGSDTHASPATTVQNANDDNHVVSDDPALGQEDEQDIETWKPVTIEISGSSGHSLASRTQGPEQDESKYNIGKEAEIEIISKRLTSKENPRYPCVNKALRCADNSLQNFLLELRKRGLSMVVQEGDGNCLFRAISLQVYGDSDQHCEIRRRCIEYMEKEKEHFSQFVNDEPFDLYVLRKRRDGVHGNNLEIQALSELFNRPVEVFVPENGATPINIFHTDYKTTDVPIRLSYHDGNHYNAIVDPLCPTAGLGLGLPGLEPGLADRLQLEQAKDESDKLHVRKMAEESYRLDLQRAIDESKLSAGPTVNNDYNSKLDIYAQQKLLALSDWEETNSELEQAAIQSSMESFWSTEQNRKQPWIHSHRRRHNIGNKSHLRTGSPSYQSDNHDRLRPISPNQYATELSTTNIESSRLFNNSQGDPPHRGDFSNMNVPLSSSSFASYVPAVSTVDNEHPRPDLADTSLEYPQTVQELVVNGFELSKVLRAYELIGDNFDDMLSFLLSQV